MSWVLACPISIEIKSFIILTFTWYKLDKVLVFIYPDQIKTLYIVYVVQWIVFTVGVPLEWMWMRSAWNPYKRYGKKCETKCIAPKGSIVVSVAKGRGGIIAKFVFFFSVFPIFPVSRKVPKTGFIFLATAGRVGEEIQNTEWSSWERRYCFYLYFESFMSWLIFQNDREFPDFGKAGSLLCKIGYRKSNYHCGEVWRDKIQNNDSCLLILIPVFLFIFGWIAEGWEAYSHKYRHYVSQCPVSAPRTDYKDMRMAPWHGHGKFSENLSIVYVSMFFMFFANN